MSEFDLAAAPADVSPAPEPSPAPPPAAVDLADDALVNLKIDGQTVAKPWKDARTQMMLHGDYTRSKQELAEQRRAFEQQQTAFEAERQRLYAQAQTLSGVMNDPAKIAALYMAAASQQQAAGQPAGPQPLTADALPQLQQQILQQADQALGARFAAYEQQRVAADYSASLDTFTKDAIKTLPVLSQVPGIEDVIYGQVERMGPRTLQEAQQYISTVAENLRQHVQSTLGEAQKQAALSKAKVEQGVEPAGGQATSAAPRAYKGKGVDKYNDPQWRADAIAALTSAFGG